MGGGQIRNNEQGRQDRVGGKKRGYSGQEWQRRERTEGKIGHGCAVSWQELR